MNLILIGLSLIFIDITVAFGAHHIDFTPDFIGYIILLAGCSQMIGESEKFKKIRPFAMFMALYSEVVYLLDALGLTFAGMGGLRGALYVAAVFVPLYMVYMIILAVHDIEVERHAALGYKTLYRMFTPLAVTQTLAFVFSVVYADLAAVTSTAASAFGVLFMYYFYRTKRAYDSLPPKESESGQSGDGEKKETVWERYNR